MYEKLTGTAVTFKDVEAKLRVGVDGTASFADIKDAASSFGTRLRAKRLTPEDRIDRIMIVALKRGTQGHFVVVRPVGHTGNLVQVFDTTEEPQVLDESIFRAQHGWTGNVLVEAAWRDWLGYGWIAAGLLCCCAALVTRLRLPFSWSRQVLP